MSRLAAVARVSALTGWSSGIPNSRRARSSAVDPANTTPRIKLTAATPAVTPTPMTRCRRLTSAVCLTSGVSRRRTERVYHRRLPWCAGRLQPVVRRPTLATAGDFGMNDGKAETTSEQERNPDHDVPTAAHACGKTLRIAVRMPLQDSAATNACTKPVDDEEHAQDDAGDRHD